MGVKMYEGWGYGRDKIWCAIITAICANFGLLVRQGNRVYYGTERKGIGYS